jgi:glycosyltransferase involved in cell wall biosynthesis
MSTLDTTIIICTYNRSRELSRTLGSLSEMILPAGLQWEVVVVDNNSSDATRQICLEHQAKLPLRYLFEKRQGKSFALNSGAQTARGEFLIFTDDDVRVDRQWLSALWDAHQRYPGKVFFGGRVLPLWEKPPPRWVSQNLSTLTVLFPHLDWGDQEKKADIAAGELFAGGNSAYPRSAFGSANRFSETVGLLEQDAKRGYRVGLEDTEFVRHLVGEGWQGVYVPSAMIRHLHVASRYSEKYLRKFYMGAGMALVRLNPSRSATHQILGAPRYLWRLLVSTSIRFLLTRLFCGSKLWVPAECQMAVTWGQIVEYRAARKANSAAGTLPANSGKDTH